MTGYIIKKIIGSWDGCNGYDETERYTNWIFLSEEKAKSKAAEFNKEYGHYGCGSSLKYVTEVCEIDEFIDSLQAEPVSDNLEEAAKNHAAERYRTTRDRELAEKCKWSFKAGAEWQKRKMEERV